MRVHLTGNVDSIIRGPGRSHPGATVGSAAVASRRAMRHAKRRGAPPLRARTPNTRDETGSSAQATDSPRTGTPGSAQTGLFSSFRRKRAFEVSDQRCKLQPPGAKPHKQILPDQTRLFTPKPFPKKTLGTITIHSARKQTLRYDQAEPGIVETVGSDLDGNRARSPGPGNRKDLGDRFAPEPLCLPIPLNVAQTPSRARPFARRARITALPPRVRMRTRNPCVRLRRTTDG